MKARMQERGDGARNEMNEKNGTVRKTAGTERKKGGVLRRMLTVLLAAAMLFSLSGLSALAEDGSLEKLLQKGEMVLGLDVGFAPMGFYDENGDIVGYDIDLAREVCARLGVTLRCQPIEWLLKKQELNMGAIDCIWNGMSINADREENMALSVPYLANNQVLVVLGGSAFETMADLAGSRLGVQGGSSAEEALNDTPAFRDTLGQVVPFDDYTVALMDLDMGGVDTVLMDEVVANYYINEKQADYRILSETLIPEAYAVGFRKGDTALRDKVNGILNDMAADGTLAEITRRWFGENVSLIGQE